MKKDIELISFNLKKDKWVYIVILDILYFLVFPFFIYKIMDFVYLNYDLKSSIFEMLQKILFVIMIILEYFMSQKTIQSNMRELNCILNHRPKWYFLYLVCILFHIITLPIYIYISINNVYMIDIILVLMFQSVVLTSIFYSTLVVSKMSIVSFGIMICYILIFTNIENPLSLFIMTNGVNLIGVDYYLKWTVVLVSCLIIGRSNEKKLNN